MKKNTNAILQHDRQIREGKIFNIYLKINLLILVNEKMDKFFIKLYE